MIVYVDEHGQLVEDADGQLLTNDGTGCVCCGGTFDCGAPGCSNFLQLCTGLWAAAVAMSGSSSVSASGIELLYISPYDLNGTPGTSGVSGEPPPSSSWPAPHGVIINQSLAMSIPSERPSPANPWGDASTSIGRYKDYKIPIGGGSFATYTFDALAQNGISVSVTESNALAITFYSYNGGSPASWSNSGPVSPSLTVDLGYSIDFTTNHNYSEVDSSGTPVAFTHTWGVYGAGTLDRLYGYVDPYDPRYIYGAYSGVNSFEFTHGTLGGWNPISYAIGTGGLGVDYAGGTTPFNGTSWGVCGSTTAHTGHYTTTFPIPVANADSSVPTTTASSSNGSFSVAVTPTAQTNTAASGPRKVTITGTLYAYLNLYTNKPTSYEAYHVERDGIPSDVGEGEELPLSVTPVSFSATLVQQAVASCGVYYAVYNGPGVLDNGGGGVNTFAIANVQLTRVGPALWKLTLGDSLYPSSAGAVLLKVGDGVDPTTLTEVEQFLMPLTLVQDADTTLFAGGGGYAGVVYTTHHYEPGDGNGTDEYFTGNGLAIVETALVSGDPTYACDTQCGQSDVPQIILSVSAPGISVEGVLADQVTPGVAAWVYTSDDGQTQVTVEWNATTKRYEVVAYKLISGTFVAQKTFTIRCLLGQPYPMAGNYTPATSGTASVDVP